VNEHNMNMRFVGCLLCDWQNVSIFVSIVCILWRDGDRWFVSYDFDIM